MTTLSGPLQALARFLRLDADLLSAAVEASATAERDRQARQAAAKRQARLTSLARRQNEAWDDVEAFIATKRPTEYDSAVELLLDLKALAEGTDDLRAFGRRLTPIFAVHD
jgi:hypothetical protein